MTRDPAMAERHRIPGAGEGRSRWRRSRHAARRRSSRAGRSRHVGGGGGAPAFGDGSVYLEHYVEGARHIEVQLLGDATARRRDRRARLLGAAATPEAGRGSARAGPDARRSAAHARARGARGAIGRRAQRGHRRVPGDTPTGAAFPGGQRTTPGGARRDGAGVRDRHRPGADLDRRRAPALRPGASRRRPRWPIPTRHAIELRVSAEDPARAFAPTPGRSPLAGAGRSRRPDGLGRRGGECRHRRLRPNAGQAARRGAGPAMAPSARARRAVAEMEIGGIQTTLPFHVWLLRPSGVRDGRRAHRPGRSRLGPGASCREAPRACHRGSGRAAPVAPAPCDVDRGRSDRAAPRPPGRGRWQASPAPRGDWAETAAAGGDGAVAMTDGRPAASSMALGDGRRPGRRAVTPAQRRPADDARRRGPAAWRRRAEDRGGRAATVTRSPSMAGSSWSPRSRPTGRRFASAPRVWLG